MNFPENPLPFEICTSLKKGTNYETYCTFLLYYKDKHQQLWYYSQGWQEDKRCGFYGKTDNTCVK